jgi:hypothetical protein
MSLETHFQYENPILGRFEQSGLQRKKIQTAISMLLLRAVFFMFSWAKKKLKIKNRLPVEFQNSM